ncbi:MAG: hypothetical protein COV74_05850 [Candidatus Omnitrophica bacterium CG11_big_fil_rev_8_21_14_0_20_45_26]|uniref:Endonuclease/exonuclease/phosphatase domain-containing protein n=1 Tax=Candidatus Abzuiibacterium crystallinum TaxID=1974748 RepID=A0A2H0LPB2_9BACT|nr:MAG: hypothetical protein COV74_05850 [Candidatus Omnitrophica bacterium CG11_big_fil_rev_8_21_14_0_20_45_26]
MLEPRSRASELIKLSIRKFGCFIFVFSLLAILPTLNAEEPAGPLEGLIFIKQSGPEYLSFNELAALSQNKAPSPQISEKVERLFNTPFINNEAFDSGARPRRPHSEKLGAFLRVLQWNIEKSLHLDWAVAVMADFDRYIELIDFHKARDLETYDAIVTERELLKDADILILQEIEIGVKRSKYYHSPDVLARSLNMNYAYAAQYLEVDPVQLGFEHIYDETGQIDRESEKYFSVDPEQYKGLFGSVVLSRYPIKYAEAFPLQTQGYDWYQEEKKKTSYLENARRVGAKLLLASELHREIKVGGRGFFRVDLHIPGLPNDTLTVINIHLEIKCLPAKREEQIKEILGYIKDIPNPVIMAGDFNSAPTDLSPTNTVRVAERTIKNPETWASVAVNAVVPQSLLVNTSRFFSNLTKNYQNPTAKHVPFILPNNVKGMFDAIQNFRFADGRAFDFRGDKNRSTGRSDKILANSNERDLWGYKTTFQTPRTVANIIGKYRLDWFFVKSYLSDPLDHDGPYRLAPHFGRTLTDLNRLLKEPISDHDPSIIDIPFNEPDIE